MSIFRRLARLLFPSVPTPAPVQPDAPVLRCRPGDVVVFVRDSQFINSRGIAYGVPCAGAVGQVTSLNASGLWVFVRPVRVRGAASLCGRFFSTHFEIEAAADDLLQPLRDSDGADETLTWAPKPECVEA